AKGRDALQAALKKATAAVGDGIHDRANEVTAYARREPVGALTVATGVGFLVGLCLAIGSHATTGEKSDRLSQLNSRRSFLDRRTGSGWRRLLRLEGAMRRGTQQEGESWRALAQRHGFGSAEGRFVLGRFIVEDRNESDLVLCVVTPIPAGLDAETPQLKALPVMFDRTPADEIVVPGRWWQLMFENVSTDAAAP